MCVFVFWEVGKWEMKGERLLEASFYFIVLFSLLSLSFLFIIKARKPGITCLRVNANSCSWFLTVHALSLSPAWILSFLSLSHTFYGLYCHDDGEVKFFLKLEVDFCVCVCKRSSLKSWASARQDRDWLTRTNPVGCVGGIGIPVTDPGWSRRPQMCLWLMEEMPVIDLVNTNHRFLQ